MSNVIMEAMATQLTVIASDVGGTPELIIDGKTGLLFGSNCEYELLSLLEKAITDSELRERLGRNAYKKIVEDHSFEATSKRYLDVYNK